MALPTAPIKAIRDGFILLPVDPAAPAGTKLGWGDPVIPGLRPETTVTACTTLIPTGGVPPLWQVPIEQFTVQLCTYHPTAGDAYTRAWQAYAQLHQRTEWLLTSWRAELVEALQQPYVLPQEGTTGLFRVVFNFLATLIER